MQCSVIDKQVSYSCIKEKKLIVTSCTNLPKYDLLNISNLDKLLQQQTEIFTAYVDSKVTVGMVLHSGLIKDDKSKYTKIILDFISFVDGIPDFLPKHY